MYLCKYMYIYTNADTCIDIYTHMRVLEENGSEQGCVAHNLAWRTNLQVIVITHRRYSGRQRGKERGKEGKEETAEGRGTGGTTATAVMSTSTKRAARRLHSAATAPGRL